MTLSNTSQMTAEQIIAYVKSGGVTNDPATVVDTPRQMYDANVQWANRPPDQRFDTMEALRDSVAARRARSQEFNHVDIQGNLEAKVVKDGPMEGNLYAVSYGDEPAIFSNWSFGQYNSVVGGPDIRWLRDMPAPVAAMAINASIKYRGRVDEETQVKLLAAPPFNGEPGILRAMTSPKYGRIWDEQIVRVLMKMNHDGRWVVPGVIAGKGMANQYTTVTKQSTTLYASDRDIWVFLVDEQHPVTVDGKEYFRGFIVSNSEVGDSKFVVKSFLLSAVCMNRIIWGAVQIREIKMRHTSGAPSRFIEEVVPVLAAYAEASPRSLVDAMHQAKKVTVGETIKDAVEFLKEQGFNQLETQLIPALAEGAQDIGSSGDPTSIWDLVMAGTAYARTMAYADARVTKEEQFGRLLDKFALPR